MIFKEDLDVAQDKRKRYFIKILKSGTDLHTRELIEVIFNEQEYNNLIRRLFALRLLTDGRSQVYVSRKLKMGIKRVNNLAKKLKTKYLRFTPLFYSEEFRIEYKRWIATSKPQ